MSDDFDAILDRCLVDVAAGRETIDSCLRRYSADAVQLAKLLNAAGWLRSVPMPAPLSLDKRRALESRLLRRAEQLRTKTASRSAASRPFLRRRAALVLTASILVVVLLLTSAVSASASSVPGDFLYPLKRTAEQVRLTLAPQQEQLELHLEFAQQRLVELQALAGRGEVSDDLLAEIPAGAEQVLERLSALPPAEQLTLLTRLTNLQDQQVQLLERVASAAQGETHSRVMAVLADTAAQRQQAMQLLAAAASDQQPRGNSPQEPPPAGEAATNEPTQGQPTTKPNPTEKPAPQAPARATKAPPATPQEPTPKAEHTPPGKANQPTPHVPPEKPTKAPKN